MTSTEKYPQYLDQPESRRLEFKENFPKGEQVARTAVAFANGAGGRMVFGVKDSPREIIGIPEGQLFTMEERITNSIFNQCAPAIVPEVYIQSAAEKTLLVVEIFPGSNKPYYIKKRGKNNGTYIRVGSTNRKASNETIEALERQHRKVSFDSLPVYDCGLEDVNLKPFQKAYRDLTGNPIGKNQLRNLGLLTPEREQVHPTHAALLLSDSPARKRYFPYAKIECARFKGTDRQVFLDQASIDEPIFASIEPCMSFIKKNIALGSTIGEIYREDRWEYPMEAIREALINAVIHRAYSILGSDIKVAIYDDMLEISSPGPLPDLLSFEDLGTGRSEIRNRVLAPIFKDMKLIEAWGSGIQKMKTELKDYPEIELVLQEAGHAFQVQFIKKGPKKELGRDQVGTKQGPSKDQVGTKRGPTDKKKASAHKINDEQFRLLQICTDAKAIVDLMKIFVRSNRTKFKDGYIAPLMAEGLLEMTEPDSPNSPTQKYRTSEKGKELIKER
jgi:ATP-dependent DNA helicase RecG